MQELRILKIGWDESIPQELHSAWEYFVSDLTNLSSLKIPRYCLAPNSQSAQLHGSCNSSIRASGCCFTYLWKLLLERFLCAFSLLNLVLHLQKDNRYLNSNCVELNFWQNCTQKSKICSRFQTSKYFSGRIPNSFFIGSSSTPQLCPFLLATGYQKYRISLAAVLGVMSRRISILLISSHVVLLQKNSPRQSGSPDQNFSLSNLFNGSLTKWIHFPNQTNKKSTKKNAKLLFASKSDRITYWIVSKNIAPTCK